MTDDYYYKYLKYKTKYVNQIYNQFGSGNYSHKISIQNPRETPWLDWIDSGVKKYEGRLNRGIFKKIKVGDNVIWYDKASGKEVATKITTLKHYASFEEAFGELRTELVPIENANAETVRKLYSKYFSEKDIKNFGVVALGIELVE